MSVDKYEFVTDAMMLFDELDRLKTICAALEKEQREFKVSSGSGELTERVRKVYEYGKEMLAKEAFSFGWHSIGVNESDDGRCSPSSTVDEWAVNCIRGNKIPHDFSAAEVMDICRDVIQREYDAEWEKERSSWLEKKGGDDDGN